MPRVCILTDSTAQFTRTNFPGRERVFIASFDLQPVAHQGANPRPPRFSDPRLIPPSLQTFLHLYQELSQTYDSILVMTVSSLLSPVAQHALSASAQFSNHADVEVLDTRTTAAGLGWLVETAAGAASAGETMGAVIQKVRAVIPYIYSLFFLPDLNTLAENGHLSPAQAQAAEILGMFPIFMLEDGRLSPLEKGHSPRAVVDCFEEFLDEFESPRRVALAHGAGQDSTRTRPLRQHIQEVHPEAHFSEHIFPPHLAALLGTKSIGMAIMQKGSV
ncbi:MAG: DegV family protein [Chloroflexota bacterium]